MGKIKSLITKKEELEITISTLRFVIMAISPKDINQREHNETLMREAKKELSQVNEEIKRIQE